jgi:hypothetical protein
MYSLTANSSTGSLIAPASAVNLSGASLKFVLDACGLEFSQEEVTARELRNLIPTARTSDPHMRVRLGETLRLAEVAFRLDRDAVIFWS